jgi:NUMOD4 motif.
MDDRYEEWRPIAGYADAYEVSSLGRVRSVERVVRAGPPPGTRTIPASMLTVCVGASPYPQVTLRRKTFAIHGLVAAAFLGERPPGMEVCHNDGDPLNSRLGNLRYDTVSENRLDTVRHGRNHFSNRTHCPKGHAYDAVNTGKSGRRGRRCLTCHREAERAAKRWQKAS